MPNDQSLEQAAYWFAILRNQPITEKDMQAWEEWYCINTEHQQAWAYIEQVQQTFAPLHKMPHNLRIHKTLTQANKRLVKRRSVLLSFIALAGSSLTISWLWRAELSQQTGYWLADLKTPTGKQQQHLLSDGSHLWLNTYSAVNLKYDQHTRLIEFITGEIFIKTAKDKRPLKVNTNYAQLTALGTEFNILEKESTLELTVHSGAVRLETATQNYVIEQGYSVTFNASEVDIKPSQEQQQPSWLSGIFIAKNIPLIDLVTQLRRYFSGHISLDSQIEQLRVFGRFPITNTHECLALLSDSLPIQINQRFSWWINLEAQKR